MLVQNKRVYAYVNASVILNLVISEVLPVVSPRGVANPPLGSFFSFLFKQTDSDC